MIEQSIDKAQTLALIQSESIFQIMKDAPKSIESDDERFDELMELQDPMRLGDFEEDVPKTIEDKYERQILMEKVIQPLVERLFDQQTKGQNAQ